MKKRGRPKEADVKPIIKSEIKTERTVTPLVPAVDEFIKTKSFNEYSRLKERGLRLKEVKIGKDNQDKTYIFYR